MSASNPPALLKTYLFSLVNRAGYNSLKRRTFMFNLSKDEITFEVVQTFCSEWQEGVARRVQTRNHKRCSENSIIFR